MKQLKAEKPSPADANVVVLAAVTAAPLGSLEHSSRMTTAGGKLVCAFSRVSVR